MIFDFILVVLTAVSVANIITEEYVFGWARKLIIKMNCEFFTTLFHCITCMSFWSGFVAGFIVYGVSPYTIAAAFVSSILGKVIKLFEE